MIIRLGKCFIFQTPFLELHGPAAEKGLVGACFFPELVELGGGDLLGFDVLQETAFRHGSCFRQYPLAGGAGGQVVDLGHGCNVANIARRHAGSPVENQLRKFSPSRYIDILFW